MEEELAQEGKDEEEIRQEIDDTFNYVDATMDGGECHYVFWENLAVYPYDEKHFSQHVINFHGHTHQIGHWIDKCNPFTYHVGVDSHNCTPVHIDQAIGDIRQLWTFLGALPTPSKPMDLYPYNSII